MNKNLATPNAIIAGVTKAGSTSLFTYLSDHPAVCGSTVKEINHFTTVRFREDPNPIENYNQYFAHCSNETIRLESSPAYFLGGQELAQAVHEALPETKIILVLREPVSRCISHFKFNQSMLRLPQDMSLDQYFEKCREIPYETFRNRGSYLYYGLASGVYANYIDGWINTFGPNLHICFFDDLKSNPKAFTKQLCQWLGVDDSFYDDYDFVIENKGRNFKNPGLQKLALKLNEKFEGFLRRHIGFKRVLRTIYFRLNGSSSQKESREDQQSLDKFRQYYEPHNQVLREKLLQANIQYLPEWLGAEK